MWSVESKNVTLLGGLTAAIIAGIYVLWGPSGKKKTRKRDLCPGLINLGNTCFLNSVLQALAPCSSIVSWLAEFIHKDKHRDSSTPDLSGTLCSVVKVLNNDSIEHRDEYCASGILECLRARRWVITSDQQDAHEMLHVLTETLDEEAKTFPRVVPLFEANKLEEDEGTEYLSSSSARCRTQASLPVLSQRTADNPLRGLLASQLQCQRCAHKCPVKYDTFDSLSLSIPTSGMSSLTLDRLLRHYISSETVQNVECEGCARKQRHAQDPSTSGQSDEPSPRRTFNKKLTIGKLPRCLCIHVKRTIWLDSGLPMKRFDYVHFPEVLNMSQYVYHKKKRPNTLPLNDRDMQIRLVGGKSRKNGFNQVNKQLKSPSPTVTSPYSGPVNVLKALNYHSRVTMSGLVHPLTHAAQTTQSDARVQQLAHKYSTEASLGVVNGHAYKLTSVIVHLGDVFSGHFITYRRIPSTNGQRFPDKWLYTSDTEVRKANLAEVLQCNAYMLFYEKI